MYTLPATLLVNPVDLTPSAKVVSPATARPGEIVAYTVTVANTGLAPAEAASLQDPLPTNLRYEEGSLQCSAGRCQASGNAITWTGAVSRTAAVTLTYRAVVTGVLSHGAHITNTATLQDGLGRTITRTAVVAVALSELSKSAIVFDPLPVAAGARVTLRVLLRNSGAETADATMSLTLPPTLTLVSGSLRCGIGLCRNEGARILWSGTLPPRGLVPVQMEVDASSALVSGDWVAVEADVEDLRWGVAHRITGGFTAAWLTFMSRIYSGPPPLPPVFLPLVGK
ncbi:MAG: DUF11 domain-containing protein [Caldilineae bacterium]|nr:MAG: DUF11 domain-containing protein [Caldilineae bacterium]